MRFEQVAKKDCPTCDGSGQVHSHNPTCWDCDGIGQVPADVDAFLIANGWEKLQEDMWRNTDCCDWNCGWSQALRFVRMRQAS